MTRAAIGVRSTAARRTLGREYEKAPTQVEAFGGSEATMAFAARVAPADGPG